MLQCFAQWSLRISAPLNSAAVAAIEHTMGSFCCLTAPALELLDLQSLRRILHWTLFYIWQIESRRVQTPASNCNEQEVLCMWVQSC